MQGLNVGLTSFPMKELANVTMDQKKIPTHMISFRLYLSPRYPNRGAKNM